MSRPTKCVIDLNVLKDNYKAIKDFSKRTFKAGMMTSKVYYNGYKKIGIPFYKRIWALKPVIAAILPNSFMYKYHSNKLRKKI